MNGDELRLSAAGASRQGNARGNNEDHYGVAEEYRGQKDVVNKGYLYVVADGMGGHAAGQEASHRAVRRVFQDYYGNPSADIRRALGAALGRANEEVWETAAHNPELEGMGTTLVAAVVKGSTLYLANVGDSRAYSVRGGRIRQISRDHSWVAEQVRAGVLKPEDAKRHPYRNVITRSVGAHPSVEVDTFQEELQGGDRVLLCSDGVSGVLDDRELAGMVAAARTASEGISAIMRQVKARKGADDHTAVIISMPGGPRGGGVGKRPPTHVTALAGGALVVLVAVAVILGSRLRSAWPPTPPPAEATPVDTATPLPEGAAPALKATAPVTVPTSTPIALTATPTVTFTPQATETPTASPVPEILPAPHGLWDEVDQSKLTLSWQWDGVLAEGEAFIVEIVVQPRDQDDPEWPHPLGFTTAAMEVRTDMCSTDMWPKGTRTYRWTVGVFRTATDQPASKVSDERVSIWSPGCPKPEKTEEPTPTAEPTNTPTKEAAQAPTEAPTSTPEQ